MSMHMCHIIRRVSWHRWYNLVMRGVRDGIRSKTMSHSDRRWMLE